MADLLESNDADAALTEAEENNISDDTADEETTNAVEIQAATSDPRPLTKMQASLWNTLSDMTLRSEVQESLNSMLMDVETTFYLKQELQVQASKHAMETVAKHHQATILEADAERQAREAEHSGLADQMVQEVMSLSRELEELIQWKRDHAHKVQEYEGLVAKLAQTEEDLQMAKEEAQKQISTMAEAKTQKAEEEYTEDDTHSTGSPTKEEAPSLVEETNVEAAKPSEEKPAKGERLAATPVLDGPSPDNEEELSPTAKAVVPQDEETNTEDDAKLAATEESSSSPEVAESPTTASAAAAAAAVTLDADEPEDEVPGLVQVDVEILMAIFGFLDAMDILNMAQINLSMYSKIDNIFGISEDGQSPPQPTPTPAPASATTSAATRTAPAPAPTTTTAAPTSKPGPSSAAVSSSGAPSAASAAAAVASGPIGNRLFSMLQPARTGPGGTKKPNQGLNPSVAQSMASKLSDTELAAILSMTDKLNKMDKEVNILRNEKEAMIAKLDGTEAVKQFLINKVRDVEIKLTQSRDEEIKVTQQIASDQEVIAFLDTRVQELERQTEALTKEKSRAQSELDTIKVQTSKKITMLSDMLKYEREKLKDEEGEWKATKKVLVKEVKSCRAQILALQAERDGLKEQNEMLKRAIVSTGKGTARSTSPLR